MTQSKDVVIGLDGSPDASKALEYAIEEATLRGAHLKVVVAYAVPQYSALGQPYPVLTTPEQVETDVITAARALVNKALDGAKHPPPVSVVARPGDAGDVLTDCAADAGLLVVGHRGRGALASTVLGSVGLRCVLHARCPVTIVRAGHRRQPVQEQVAAATPARRAAAATS